MISTAYRFFDRVNGSHFYTTNIEERDSVIANIPSFQYDGAVFNAMSAHDPGAVAVHRFYDGVNGTHFFTASVAERDSVMANIPSFKYEGVAFGAAAAPADGLVPVFRFYNATEGAHFYTAGVEERDFVMSRIPDYRYEGIAFYEPAEASWSAPVLAPEPIASPGTTEDYHRGNAWYGAPNTNDVMMGVAEKEVFYAYEGDDTIFGGGGDDWINAGPGNDVITGGPGDDWMTGGPGADRFNFVRGDGRDTITDFEAGDVLHFSKISPKEVSGRATPEGFEVYYGGISGQGGGHGTILLLDVFSVAYEAYSFV